MPSRFSTTRPAAWSVSTSSPTSSGLQPRISAALLNKASVLGVGEMKDRKLMTRLSRSRLASGCRFRKSSLKLLNTRSRNASWPFIVSGHAPELISPPPNRGVCTVVHDTTGQLKTFRLSKNGATVQAEVEYMVRLAPGENFRAPDASIVFHGGDWHEGFQAYRDWVHSWYRRAGVRSKWLPS